MKLSASDDEGSGEKEDPDSHSDEDKSNKNKDDLGQKDTDNQDLSPQNSTRRRGKIVREAMRDVFISIALLVLTTLITYGDFQQSPSSLLASGGIIEVFDF